MQQLDRRRVQKIAKMKRLKLQPLSQLQPDALSSAVSKAAETLFIEENSIDPAIDEDEILDVVDKQWINRIVNKKR